MLEVKQVNTAILKVKVFQPFTFKICLKRVEY